MPKLSRPAQSGKRFKFTSARLLKLPLPAKGDDEYSDTECRSLKCRVFAGGSRAFYFRKRIHGKVELQKLGTVESLPVADARQQCHQLAARLQDGQNALQTRRTTLGACWSLYWSEHATKAKKSASRHHDQRQWERFLSKWELKPVRAITPAMVAQLHGDIGEKHGQVSANRCLTLLRAVLNHSLRHQLIESNPAANIRKFTEKPRERVLDDEEIRLLFKGLESECDDFADVIKLLVFSGRRRGEVLAMRWCDIDLTTGIWELEDTKAGAITAYLPPDAIAILKRRAEGFAGQTGRVFPNPNDVNLPMRAPESQWKRFRRQNGLDDVTLHDLRRSFATLAARGNAAHHAIARALGHQVGSRATAIYTVADHTDIKAVGDLVAEQLKERRDG